MRVTLGNAKDPMSGIARVLNLSPTDARFTGYVNESIQRLIQTGELFWGTYARYQFCLTDGCLVWPREIAAIESVAVCSSPLTIRNQWFEFIDSVGLQGDGSSGCSSGSCGWPYGGTCGGGNMYDRGTVPTFADIIGASKKIKVYCDIAEAAGAKILLQGFDANNNWIQTEVAGVWTDGEYVSLNAAVPQTSTKFFSSLVSVQKPITKGAVRLYEYDTVLTTQRALAVYEPSETNPVYRRTMIPGLSNGSGDDEDECNTTQVTVMAKLEFIPAIVDTDWLLIGNLPAIKDMCQSIRKAENNEFSESVQWEARAVQALRRELSHYRGHGVVQPIRMVPRSIGGPAVLNLQ